MARDGSPYVGIEAGVMAPEDGDFDITVSDGLNEVRFEDGLTVDYSRGLDGDIIAGFQ